MKRIVRTPSVERKPNKLKDIWFQHHSPIELSLLRPQTYEQILVSRSQDMGLNAAQYVNERTFEEDEYRIKLAIHDDSTSFTYATIVGFNKMEPAESYPGFTYFFQLNAHQIKRTLFGVVCADKMLNIAPKVGFPALKECLEFWAKHSNDMNEFIDPIVGLIEPRIEVIIPYDVAPAYVVVEREQRITASP